MKATHEYIVPEQAAPQAVQLVSASVDAHAMCEEVSWAPLPGGLASVHVTGHYANGNDADYVASAALYDLQVACPGAHGGYRIAEPDPDALCDCGDPECDNV